jgi:hypothetical protein
MQSKQKYRYCFIEYGTVEAAQQAVKKANGHQLDASHKLRVMFYEDMKASLAAPDEYIPPVVKPYQPRVRQTAVNILDKIPKRRVY